MPDQNNLSYINSTVYKDVEDKIKDLVQAMSELNTRSVASRRLRYVEVDIEGERKAGKLQADELYIPQHIIDSNIRAEQSSYVQYVTQSPRAVILKDKAVPATESANLETDITNRLRYQGWQIPLFSCIDGFQQDGYGIMEIVYDETKPGHLAHEHVQLGNFAFIADTQDIQEAEMLIRSYFFSRTKILSLVESGKFDAVQTENIVEGPPLSGLSDAVTDSRDKSLYKLDKVMFRVKGTTFVAWTCESRCDDWLAKPVPLFIGRRVPYGKVEGMKVAMQTTLTKGPQAAQAVLGVGKESYETDYPYVIFPYLISENPTISQAHGRVHMDQDAQEGASSLMSSFCTAHRRAANMYFSKDTDDPNADLLLQKNVYFEPGAIINAKIKQFQLQAPDAEVMQAIMTIVSANKAETSQVNFAAMNRKDSRKTATEISAASQSAQSLSTVQVVLFSNSLCQLYTKMFEIIQSRVVANLITDVDTTVKQLYGKVWSIRPSGDVDVIERQQMVQAMMSAWSVVQNTPANIAFLCDLLMKMFPEQGMKYVMILQQSQQQQQSAQAQQQQQVQQMVMQTAKQLGDGIINLSEHPEYWSEVGRIQAEPKIQDAAKKVKEFEKQLQQK